MYILKGAYYEQLQLQTLDSVELLAMVMKLTKIILTMPAANAISERNFSALRRMKTWLRSTMNQTRLNWCMVLHIHNDTDKLNIADVANEFVSRNSTRSHILEDLCKIFCCLLLFQLASKCILDTLKSQNFPGEHAPGPP